MALSVLHRAGELLFMPLGISLSPCPGGTRNLEDSFLQCPLFQPHPSSLSSNPPSSVFYLLSYLTVEVSRVYLAHTPGRVIVGQAGAG